MNLAESASYIGGKNMASTEGGGEKKMVSVEYIDPCDIDEGNSGAYIIPRKPYSSEPCFGHISIFQEQVLFKYF